MSLVMAVGGGASGSTFPCLFGTGVRYRLRGSRNVRHPYCRASSRAPAPSVATRAGSAATSCAGAPMRSRIVCQRIEGSESRSHFRTDLSGFGVCRLGGLLLTCCFSLLPQYTGRCLLESDQVVILGAAIGGCRVRVSVDSGVPTVAQTQKKRRAFWYVRLVGG